MASLGGKYTIAEGESGRSGPGSPLVVQAEAFARHLAGPEEPAPSPLAAPQAESTLAAPAPPMGLTLHATSFYPDQPRRSMALISMTSAPQEEPRWVKEGARIDVFLVHEIRPSLIVYRQGDQLHEAAVANQVHLPSLIRDPRKGSHTVGLAPGIRSLGAWPARGLGADPNGVEISSN